MADLKYGPQHLMLLLSIVAGVLGILHFIAEFEQCVFDFVEALRRGLAVA